MYVHDPLFAPTGKELFLDIAFDVFGHGRPVLFLHSGLTDRTMWTPQIETFASRFTCFFVDLPGFGASPTPVSPFVYAESIAHFIETVIGQPAALVGSSFGAGIAFDTAQIAPEWTGPLALVSRASTAENEPSAALQAVWRDADEAWERGERDRAVEIEIEAWVDGQGRPGGTADPAIRDWFLHANRSVWERHAVSPPPAQELDMAVDYQRIQQPVLLIDGPYDLTDVHAANRTMLKRLPAAEYVSIAGTAHFPSVERPDEFDRIVLDFLGRVWS